VTPPKKNPWPKFGFEGILIVVSILAALWIDSWWAERQLVKEEQILLRQLKSEFEINLSLLEEKRTQHENNLAAAKALLAVSGPDSDNLAIQIDFVRQNMLRMLQWWTYNPQSGVYLEMIQSGRLGLIGSDHLRTRLASWSAQLEDLAEDEVFLMGFSNDFIRPFIYADAAMRNIAPRQTIGASSFPEDLRAILTNRQFENAVHTKFILTEEVLGVYIDLKAQLESTLELIAAEIDIY
jgi:hypothetical protein